MTEEEREVAIGIEQGIYFSSKPHEIVESVRGMEAFPLVLHALENSVRIKKTDIAGFIAWAIERIIELENKLEQQEEIKS